MHNGNYKHKYNSNYTVFLQTSSSLLIHIFNDYSLRQLANLVCRWFAQSATNSFPQNTECNLHIIDFMKFFHLLLSLIILRYGITHR